MKEIRDKCLINKSYKSAKTKPSKKRKGEANTYVILAPTRCLFLYVVIHYGS